MNKSGADDHGDRRARIAILDGEADLEHPCFAGAEVERRERASRPTTHGTQVASILFGQPGSAVEGLAPRCRGLVIATFREREGVLQPCSQVDLAHGIHAAIAWGAHVINISGGQPGGAAHPILAEAIATAQRRNVVIVAAAGNDGCSCVHVPAAVDGVLAVGAADDDGRPLASSNWGDAYASHGIVGPGANVRVALPGGRVGLATGTSYAAAHVTGVLARLVSRQLARGERPDPHRAMRALLAGAEPCDPTADFDCRRLLGGRLVPGSYSERTRGDAMSEEMKSPEVAMPAAPVVPPSTGVRASRCGCGGSGDSCSCGEKKSCGCGTTPCSCGAKKEGCGCGSSAQPPQPPGANGSMQRAYVIGSLGIDFGLEARLDSLSQQIGGPANDFRRLVDYFDANPWASPSVMWTLTLDGTPVYVVQPIGAFGDVAYARLREFLRQQRDGGIERVAIAGFVGNNTTLLNGQTVPILFPDLRGMFSWTTAALADAAGDGEGLRNFLDRVYYELRNLGRTPEDRAVNFAATNAFQAGEIFRKAHRGGLELDCIGVERSPICRPEADCWDVKLVFFDPRKRMETARRVYRFTVDVSDTIPVTIGGIRSWSVY